MYLKYKLKQNCYFWSWQNSYSFENKKGDYREDKQVKQAVAISVYGDKSAFYNCGFIGYQDTLWDVEGRHFFKDSYIEGAIDFIWGDGQSIYEVCLLFSIIKKRKVHCP